MLISRNVSSARGHYQQEVSNEFLTMDLATCEKAEGRVRKNRHLMQPSYMSAQADMDPRVCAELFIIRGFFESINEIIARGLVTSNQSIIAFAMSSRREKCGDAISDEPCLTVCPRCSKNMWRSLMVRTLLFNSKPEGVWCCFRGPLGC